MRIVIVLFVLAACVSCKNKKQEAVSSGGVKLPVIDIASVVNDVGTTPLKASELISGFDYIELEMSAESVVEPYKHQGYINTLFTPQYIYAAGQGTYDLKFDRKTGKYLGQMGVVGRGAGEYIQGKSRCVDVSNDEYIVNAGYNQNIYIYNDSNNFIRNIPISIENRYQKRNNFDKIFSVAPYKVMLLGSSIDLGNPHYDYIVMDTKNGELCYQHIDKVATEAISKIENLWKDRLFGIGQLIVWNYDNQTYYYSPQSDTIYRLDTITWEGIPRYRLDLGKYKMSIETDSKIFFTLRDKQRVVINAILETSTYLIIDYDYKEVQYRAMYNKLTGDLVTREWLKAIENDFGGWLITELKAIPGEKNLYNILTYTAVEKNTAGRSRDELTPVGQREYDLYAGRDVENINMIYRIIHLK